MIEIIQQPQIHSILLQINKIKIFSIPSKTLRYFFIYLTITYPKFSIIPFLALLISFNTKSSTKKLFLSNSEQICFRYFPHQNSIRQISIKYTRFRNLSYINTNNFTMDQDSKLNKTYFIQLMSNDNKLLNKFKFVLSVTKIKQLKQQIKEKLLAKNSIQPNDQLVIKDIDDYQLASDDEVNDVVADGKIRIYISIPKQIISSTSIQSVPQPPNSITSIKSNQDLSQTQTSVVDKQLVTDSFVIDPKSIKLPFAPENHPKNKILKAVCPQIRKSQFEIPLCDYETYLDLSQAITQAFNLPKNFKALIFDSTGQAFLFNLDLMTLQVPKLDLNKLYYIIFTVTPSVCDNVPVQGMLSQANPVKLQIIFKNKKIPISIDLDNTLSALKYKIFIATRIHPQSQIIKFANNPLNNDIESLNAYGIKENSIIELHFKVISNIMPYAYSDKFYYKDITHIHQQEEQSMRILRSNLLAIYNHFDQKDAIKLVSFIREYTNDYPLAFALKVLFNGQFLSQAHRIAIEEGFYNAILNFMKSCSTVDKTIETKVAFKAFRSFFGFCIEAISKVKNDQQGLINRQLCMKIGSVCTFTTKPITSIAQIALDNGQYVPVDRPSMVEQINKGFTYNNLKKPEVSNLKTSNQLEEAFEFIKNNEIDHTNISVIYWKGFKENVYHFVLPNLNVAYDSFEDKMNNYPQLKIHKPLEIKNKVTQYLLLLNKDQSLRVYINKNKDINKPYNIFDVINGDTDAVNLDLMTGASKTENLQEVVDLASIKPVITRQPKQAIVVLMDISGSMGSKFFNETDLSRIGAVKSFFQALAYRTIAYNFQHVVSLILFDNNIEIQCDFTEAIYDFNRFVANAKPRGSTRCYDSIVTGVQLLQKFKKRYPDCLLRILALTDGQDNASSNSMLDTAKRVVDANVVLDSFAVGTNCTGLKNVTLATGGKCFLTRNLEESLKLFEQQTVLSLRARKIEEPLEKKPIQQLIQIANSKPFDLPTSVHAFKMPEIKGQGLSAKQMALKLQDTQQQKKISGSGSLKRIAKQIQNYQKNPHPFVSIYPCSNINVWKILLLGPKQTPYENGLFVLYAHFPGDYPFRAPQVRFITPIYHCNMNSQGRICHSVFDRNYSPAITFREIIDCVYGLILTPQPEDPLDNVIASYYLSQYPKYLQNAKKATTEKASKSNEQIVEQLFGKISDDIEKQKRTKQIDDWVKLAKSFN